MADEIVIKCPVCGDKPDGSHYHCYINVERQVWHCWWCDQSGSLKKLARRFPEITAVVEVRAVNNWFGPRNVSVEPVWFSPIPATSREPLTAYLKTRGFSDEDFSEFRPLKVSRFKNRVAFGIQRGRNEAAFWTARSIDGAKPKWFIPKKGTTEMEKAESVWGLERLLRRGEKSIYICEGIFDAIAIEGVAVFGKHPTNMQLRKILESEPEDVIIAFDQDAQDEARETAHKLLRYGIRTSIITPVAFNDFGDYMQKLGLRRKIGERAQFAA